MILTGVNVNAAIGHLPQPIPVGRDHRRVVTHPMAQVKGIIGGLADSPRSAHDGMHQPRDLRKRRKLKQIVLFMFYQKQQVALCQQIVAVHHFSELEKA